MIGFKMSELLKKYDNLRSIGLDYDYEYLQGMPISRIDKVVEKDLEAFSKIEKLNFSNAELKEGDFLRTSLGDVRISVIYEDGKIQLSNSVGVYVSLKGSRSIAGCVWDSKYDNLEFSMEQSFKKVGTKKANCWTFSTQSAGGGKGVHCNIDFNVWELI